MKQTKPLWSSSLCASGGRMIPRAKLMTCLVQKKLSSQSPPLYGLCNNVTGLPAPTILLSSLYKITRVICMKLK